jgi:hypothetical protein
LEPLAQLRTFCFPGGVEAARAVRAVRNTQRGRMRTAPEARWMPYTAEEEIDATCSWFRWDARFGGGRLGFIAVTDAYEEGRGRLVVKLGGVIPVKKAQGPEYDKGELQRYLGAILTCPPILLNHATLECTANAPLTLRLRDREDPTGATVDLDLGEDGCPLGVRAMRPREAGKDIIPTPWSATCGDFREQEGIRLPTRMEVFWNLPEGPFSYFQGELTSYTILS